MDEIEIKPFYRYIPGFRSESKIKGLISVAYYIFCLYLIFSEGLKFGLNSIILPFFILYGIDSIRYRKDEDYNQINNMILIFSIMMTMLINYIF